MANYYAIIDLDDGEVTDVHFSADIDDDLIEAAKWEAIDRGFHKFCGVAELYEVES